MNFIYPKLLQSSPIVSAESKTDINGDVRSPSSKGSNSDKEMKRASKGENGENIYEEGSSETLMADLMNLRSKYNAVIEYTVNLTAERDSIVQLLEETDKELAREMSRRKLNSTDQSKSKKSDRVGEKKMGSKVRLMYQVSFTVNPTFPCIMIMQYSYFCEKSSILVFTISQPFCKPCTFW